MKTRRQKALSILVLSLVLVACTFHEQAEAGIGQVISVITQLFGAPVRVVGTPTNGQALVYSTVTGTWAAGTAGGGAPTGPASGDLGGTFPSPTVLSLANVTTTLGAGGFPLLAPNGSVGAPSYSFAAEPALGFYRSGSFTVSLHGSFAASSGVTASDFSASSGGYIINNNASVFQWLNRSVIASPADGNVELLNNSLNGFSLLQFGGTTSAFPALKRFGSALAVRVADDTNYANILAATFQGSRLSIDGSSSGTTSFIAGATPTTTVYTLPAADGTSGQALTTNGSHVLAWTSVGTSFPLLAPDGTNGAPSYSFASATGTGMFRDTANSALGLANAGTYVLAATSAGLYLGSAEALNWTSGATSTTADTTISRFGPGIGGISDGATPAEWRVYKTTDSSSSPTNSEYFTLFWDGVNSRWSMGLGKTGTGATNRELDIINIGIFKVTVVGINVFSTDGSVNLKLEDNKAAILRSGSYNATSGAVVGFSSSSSDATVAADLAISRVSPGILAVGNGAQGDTSAAVQMRKLTITGSSSGSTSFIAGATPTTLTYTLPAADGTAGQVLSTNGSQVLSWAAGGGATFPLLAPDGTAGAPSYSYSGETTLGFYRLASGINGFTGGLQNATTKVYASIQTETGMRYVEDFSDPTTTAIGVGSGIRFLGYTVGTSTAASFGAISASKENNTGGNSNGYTSLWSKLDGTGLRENLRVKSTGAVITGPAAFSGTTVYEVGSSSLESVSTSNAILTAATYGGSYSVIRTAFARGTPASPTATQSGDRLGMFDFTAHNGTNFAGELVGIRAFANQNFTTSNMGSYLTFVTTPNNASVGLTRWAIQAPGDLVGTSGLVQGWTSSSSDPTGAADTAVYRHSAGVVGFSTGASGTANGSIRFTNADILGTITTYNGLATAGLGVPSIVASARVTGQTASNASILSFTPAADGSFEISVNINATATPTTLSAKIGYNDETNTARLQLILFDPGNGVPVTAINSTGAYGGLLFRIRAKGGVAIVLQASEVSGTYNYDCDIKQVS